MIRRLATTAALLLAASPAAAHTGLHADGFAHGFSHPAAGIDHVLAMIAVGLFAAQLGRRARLALSAAFVLAMSAGALLGLAGMSSWLAEAGIVASVVALGVAVAGGVRLPLAAPIAGVAAFGMFHGIAHGAEMPADASGLAYGAGFALATVLLHGVGLGLATLLPKSTVLRPLGGAIAIAGVVLGVA